MGYTTVTPSRHRDVKRNWFHFKIVNYIHLVRAMIMQRLYTSRNWMKKVKCILKLIFISCEMDLKFTRRLEQILIKLNYFRFTQISSVAKGWKKSERAHTIQLITLTLLFLIWNRFELFLGDSSNISPLTYTL